MKKLIKNKLLLFILFILVLGGVLFNGSITRADQFEGPSLFRGDFVTIHNVTEDNPPSGWADSIDAAPGNIVEIRVVARNEGSMTANHVQVIGHVPENLGTQHVFSATLQAPYGGGTSITDTATVNIRDGSNQTFRYEPGHARIFGVTNLFNCPSGCDLSDAIASTGLEIGDIPPGSSVQVGFKARMTNLVIPTPTPTGIVTPSPTPTGTVAPTPTGIMTPTPTLTPTGTITPTPTGTLTPTPTTVPTVTPTPTTPPAVGGTVQCPSGFVQTISGSNIICVQQVQSQSQSTSSNASTGEVSVNVTSPSSSTVTSTSTTTPVVISQPGTVTTVTQLPKTGLPLVAWALSGLLPIGAGLKKFTGGEDQTSKDDPRYVWQKREFSK